MSGRTPQLLTELEFGEIFGVSVQTVQRLIRLHKIEPVTHPDLQCVRIPISQVGVFLKQWTPTNGKPIRPARNGGTVPKKKGGLRAKGRA